MADFRDRVEFRSISKTYPTEAHVDCNYVLKGSHQPSSYDWIGLFKVGWSTNKDVIFYYWAPYPKNKVDDEEHAGSVLFSSQNLPGDDGEFYQFVYFNDRNKMCGASTPFQFKTPRNDDLIEQELEDDDFLNITTNTLILEEKIRKMEVEKEILNQTCQGMTNDRDVMSEQLGDAREQIKQLQAELETLVLQIEKAEQNLKDLKNEHALQLDENKLDAEERQKEIARLSAEIETLKEELQNKETQCVERKNELDQCTGQVEALKTELALIKNHCTTAEDSKQQALNELEQMRNKLTEDVTERERIETLQAQLISSQETIDSLEKHITQQKNVIEASSAKQLVMETDRATMTETLEDFSARIEKVNTENHDLKNKLQKCDSEIKDWKKTVEDLSMEKNSLCSTIAKLDRELQVAKEKAENTDEFDAQEDRYIALQTAYGILKDELARTESELQKLQRREIKFRQSDRHIAELQAKLKLGEEEWKKAIKQKIEVERKLQRSTSRSSLSEDKVLNTSITASLSGGMDLTKEELQKMVEQLSKELELRTQKKDKYKQKYLDEKQRAATLRDDRAREVEKLHKDLELARAQLDTQILPPIHYPAVTSPDPRRQLHRSSSEIKPIVYPPVKPQQSPQSTEGGAKPKMEGPSVFSRQLTDRGALEGSITEDFTARSPPLKPLPTPLEPTRISRSNSQDSSNSRAGQDFKDELRSNLGLTTRAPETCSSIRPAGAARSPAQALTGPNETTVVTREDSDDENDGADRFHDASSDVPESMLKCFMCDHVFHSGDTAADRNAHVNEHLEQGEQESDLNYSCPVCNKEFPKDSWSKSLVEMHINSHFTIVEQDQ